MNSLPQRAESCDLGNTAVLTIIASGIFFVGLMFVCLKAPDKRPLDKEYGINYEDQMDLPRGGDAESALSGGDDYESQGSYPRGSDVYIVSDVASNTDRSLDYAESVGDRSGQSGKSGRSGRSRKSGRGNAYQRPSSDVKHVRSESSASAYSDNISYGGLRGVDIIQEGADVSNRDGRESRSARRFPGACSPDGSAHLVEISKEPPNGSRPYARRGNDAMSAGELTIRRSEQQRISESRLAKIEKMELSIRDESDDMIEKFVEDLNLSFLQDGVEVSDGSPSGLPPARGASKKNYK